MSASRLVVFDFDHTLFEGDSSGRMIHALLMRNPIRAVLALLASPVLGPMVGFKPLRRRGISGYLWLATFASGQTFDEIVYGHAKRSSSELASRLLPEGFQQLQTHLAEGDTVVIATGATPALIRQILPLANQPDLPVIGTQVKRWLGGYVVAEHCHAQHKMTMIHDAGFTDEVAVAYTDSHNDLPLLEAAAQPVAVNPKPKAAVLFRHRFGERLQVKRWKPQG